MGLESKQLAERSFAHAKKYLWLCMQAVNGSKYKWMLYGDDDTLWFTGGVLDLLKDLDPDMPYVITGMT